MLLRFPDTPESVRCSSHRHCSQPRVIPWRCGPHPFAFGLTPVLSNGDASPVGTLFFSKPRLNSCKRAYRPHTFYATPCELLQHDATKVAPASQRVRNKICTSEDKACIWPCCTPASQVANKICTGGKAMLANGPAVHPARAACVLPII